MTRSDQEALNILKHLRFEVEPVRGDFSAKINLVFEATPNSSHDPEKRVITSLVIAWPVTLGRGREGLRFYPAASAPPVSEHINAL